MDAPFSSLDLYTYQTTHNWCTNQYRPTQKPVIVAYIFYKYSPFNGVIYKAPESLGGLQDGEPVQPDLLRGGRSRGGGCIEAAVDGVGTPCNS